MAYKRLQNTLAESRLMLPFAVAVTLVAVYLCGAITNRLWMQSLCLGISAYLMVELSNTHQLIRVFGMMVPTMYLLLVCVSPILFPDLGAEIMLLCSIAIYSMLFRCYQMRQSQGLVFYGFFCLGISSLIFAQVLYYVPILWIMLYYHLRTMSGKTFCASLLGIFAPYWFAIGYYMYAYDFSAFLAHFKVLFSFGPLFDHTHLGEHEILSIGWLLLLALIGIVHYVRQGYHDKIRTRMYYGMFIIIDILTFVFLVLQPQHYLFLMPIIIVNTSPLIAHYLSLTGTWLTNITFHFILLVTLLIIFYNTWMPSSNFLSATVISACSYLPL